MRKKIKEMLSASGRGRRRRSVFVLLFVSYLVILIVSMIWSYAFFLQSDAEIREQSRLTRELLIKQQTSKLDSSLAGASRISDKLVFNEKIGLAAGQGEEFYSLEELQKILIDIGPADGVILDYYLYLRNNDMVVTPTLQISANKLYQMIYSYTGQSFAQWRDSVWAEYRFAEFLPEQEMTVLGQKKQVITYIQSIPVNRYRAPQAQIVILLDADELRAQLDEMRSVTASHIYVLDEGGDVLLTSEGAPDLGVMQGRDELEFEGETFFLSSGRGDNSRWQVVLATPESEYFRTQNELRGRFVLELVLMILIGLVVAYLFTRRGYRPIREILEMVGSEQGTPESNELEDIKRSILESHQLQLEMSDTIETHKPYMRNDYLMKLLRGIDTLGSLVGTEKNDSLEEVNRQLAEFGVAFRSPYFMTVSVLLDLESAFFKEDAQYPEVNLAMGSLVVENVGCELLQNRGITHYFVRIDRNQSVFLINLAERDETALVESAFRELSQMMLENFQLRYFAGQSEIVTDIRQVRVCFDQSQKAQDYGAMNGKSGITHYHNVADLEYDYYYPIEQELQLVNLLKAGDERGARELLSSVLEINFVSRRIGALAGRCLFVELAGTIVKVSNNLTAKEGEKLESVDLLYESLQTTESFENRRERLFEMIGSVCRRAGRKQNNQTERLVEKIADYITMSEEWLDLASIAEKFDITPQYLSTVFKKYREINVKEFISKKRLDKAKELLGGTELTVDEIARKLGYANETGLNRLFKKYEGITPGTYRNSVKH